MSGRIERGRSGFADDEWLRVHHVLRRIFDFDRLEGPRTHVKEKVDAPDAT
jgi:hypothetical protein